MGAFEWLLEQGCFLGFKCLPVEHLDSMGTAQQLALLLCKPLQGAPAGVQLLEEVGMSDLSQGTDSDSSVVCEH